MSTSGLIDDPLARFFNEEQSRNAGIKNPITGFREPVDKAKQREKHADEIKRKVQVRKHILTQLLNDDLGREWLYDMLVTCNIFGTPYTVDPSLTAYNAGALYIGRLLESDIRKADIKSYFLMCQEGWDREKTWDEVLADKI